MVGNARLSQPRNYGGDMVLESVHPIGIVSSITLCLSDIVFLRAKEILFSVCSSWVVILNGLASDFEVFLLSRDFKESLAGMVLSPDLVMCIELFYPRVASALLLIRLLMFLLTVLLHSV
jgi:hypothetical protein